MAIGKCLRCDTITALTEDHVIPKWFKKALPNFGIKFDVKENSEYVCQPCNGTKGGTFDWKHLTVRTFMKQIVITWTQEIRKHEEFNP